jgi:hypothetical protein
VNAEPLPFRVEVLLSLQRALWDMVTPSLRGVAMRLEYPLIEVRLLFETVGDGERMIASEVGANLVADFVPPVDVYSTAVAVPVGTARGLTGDEEWVYLRREDEGE